jgi:competence protein ComEC
MRTVRHRPFVSVCIAYAAGILSATYLPLTLPVVAVLFIPLWSVAVVFRHRRWLCSFLICALFAVLGALGLSGRQVHAPDHVSHIAHYYHQQPLRVRGVVARDVTVKATTWGTKQQGVLQLKAYQAPWGWQRCSGKVQLNVFQSTALRYGQAIETVGRLHQAFAFDASQRHSYRSYLRHRDIYFLLSVKKNNDLIVLRSAQGSAIKARLLSLRETLKNISDEHFSPTESALIKAMFLGDRSELPRHIKQLFAVTGTAHVLAISGLHIGIITGLIWFLSQPLVSRNLPHVLLTTTVLLIYISLSGGRVSVARASIMAITVLLAMAFDRDVDGLNTVCFSAVLILLWNPYLLFDVGFQLSFACLLSILFISWVVRPILSQRGVTRRPGLQALLYSFCLSLGIWIGVLGLIAYYFRLISPVAIIANMVVVPLMSVIVVLGAVFLMAAGWCPALIWPVVPVLELVLLIFLTLVKVLAQLPGAYVYVPEISLWQVGIYYGLIGGMFVLISVIKKTGRKG